MALGRMLTRRTLALAVLAPLAGRAAEAAATRFEQRRDYTTANRLRRAGAFLRGGNRRRFPF